MIAKRAASSSVGPAGLPFSGPERTLLIVMFTLAGVSILVVAGIVGWQSPKQARKNKRALGGGDEEKQQGQTPSTSSGGRTAARTGESASRSAMMYPVEAAEQEVVRLETKA